jgi:hypothetical protein
MRPLRQRICVAMWIVWLLFAIAATTTLASPYVSARVDVFPKLGVATNAGQVTLPTPVVDAYNTGQMSHQEQQEFEADVRSGVVALPSGKSVAFAPRYPSMGNTATNLLVFVLFPAFAAAIVQYLFVGFANPLRLFRARP